MNGVRGRGASQKLTVTTKTCKRCSAKWLKRGARANCVTGDATVDGREYTTTDQMAAWAVSKGLQLERAVPKIVYGLYSTMQDEQILIFRKDRDG